MKMARAKVGRKLVGKADSFVFSSASVEHARAILPKVRQDAMVIKAFKNRYAILAPQEHRLCKDPLLERNFCLSVSNIGRILDTTFFPDATEPFVESDEYFYPDPDPAGGHDGQRHLDNDEGWADIDAIGAWRQGATGKGVVIGIVDSGLEMTHPDLSIDESLSYDFVQDDTDPSPNHLTDSDYHGTSVAGLATAVGGNSEGVTGLAPYAQLAALRVPLSGTPSRNKQVGRSCASTRPRHSCIHAQQS